MTDGNGRYCHIKSGALEVVSMDGELLVGRRDEQRPRIAIPLEEAPDLAAAIRWAVEAYQDNGFDRP